MRARKRLRDRRAHPLRRGDRPSRTERAHPRLEREGRPAQYARERRPVPLSHRKILIQYPQLDVARMLQKTTAITSSAWGTCAAGSASRPKSSAWRSFPASPPPRSSTKATRSKGVATGDLGINRKGEKTDAYQPGMELHGKYTFFAEGCARPPGTAARGEIHLRETPQVYGIGLKELWEVKPERHQPGLVTHTAGWPLEADVYGGSFLYHLEDRLVAVGFVVGLGYRESLPVAVRGIPALQDPSGDPQDLRGRQAACATARAPSPPAGCSRCPSSCSRAAR